MSKYFICIQLLLLLVPLVITTEEANMHRDWPDHTTWSDKVMMINATKLLIKMANNKIRLANHIRDFYIRSPSFSVGLVMGNIREKYRKMLEYYREIKDKYEKRSMFTNPAISWLYPSIYNYALENVHVLELDIDKLVNVLETIKSRDARYIKTTTSKGKATRSGIDGLDVEKLIAEQEEKRRLREQFLMKKLNRPGQHTTRKRFIDQWPVEQSWRLNNYGDVM